MMTPRRDEDRVIREWLTEPTWLPPSDTERIAGLVRQTRQVRGSRRRLSSRWWGSLRSAPVILAAVLVLAGTSVFLALLDPLADGDPLSGRDLVETAIPGVVVVTDDGLRFDDEDVFSVVSTDDGEVWIERHDPDWSRHRLELLGDPDTVLPLDEHVAIFRTKDGVFAAGRDSYRVLTPDGWIEEPPPDCRGVEHAGACWTHGRDGRGLRRTTGAGTTRLTRRDLGLDPADDFGFHLGGLPGGGLLTEVTRGGRASGEAVRIDDVAILDDGWEVLDLGPPAVGDRRVRISQLAASPLDGAIWTYHLIGDELVARRFVDGRTTSFGPLRVVDRQQYPILFGDDGSVWFGSMARWDGSPISPIELPAHPDPSARPQTTLSLGPGGTAWVALHDQPPERGAGLIVIRPDAFADE